MDIAKNTTLSSFQDLPFHPQGSGFEPEKSGFKKLTTPVFSNTGTGYISTRLALQFKQEHSKIPAAIVNTAGKVVLTPITVTADIIIFGPVLIVASFK